MSRNRFRRSAIRFGLFAVLLLISLPIFPLILIADASYFELHLLPRIVGNLAFFWPQFVLLPYGFSVVEPGETTSYIMTDDAIYVASLSWAVVGVGFSRVTRDWRLIYVGLSVYPVMALVMLAVYSFLFVFGVQPYLEGP